MASRLIRSFSTASKKVNLNGIFVPLTTPFDHQENIAYDKLKDNLNHYERIPFTGYVVSGSNGEAPALSPAERVELVKNVRQSVSNGKVVIGGATSESTKTACELCEAMAGAGADGVLVMSPFYFKRRMTEEAIINHFTTVADRSPVPVVIYNMAVVTGIDIGIPMLAKLAQHPNIVGVKDGDVRKIAGTILETKRKGLDFDVLAGSAGYLLPAVQSGSCGGVNGLAGALGQAVCNLYSLTQQEKWKEAIDLHFRITKADTLLLAELGVPGLKVAMDMLGLYGGPCRKPLLSPSPSDTAKIKKVLVEDGFLKA